ncbi:MAG: ZIP family metal transporter, partial [Promethearchaeota archaeon]
MISEIIQLGAIASLIAGLATGVGALPVIFTKSVSHRTLGIMLGFSAGVMLAATSFSLLVPAIELGGIWVAVFGLLLGVFALMMIEQLLPYFRETQIGPTASSGLRRIWLFIFAITLHNFPE